MSYTFNWDCTLPIKNIEDIISINIVPETKVYDEGDYVSLRGQICIDGEYLSLTKEQFLFNECIPLDITLPNNGGRSDINIEVDNFDYKIEDGDQLCLNLNLCIVGYDLDSTPTLIEPEEEIELQGHPPVMFTKEAVIIPKSDIKEDVDMMEEDELDYLDFNEVVMPSHHDDIQLVDETFVPEDVEIPKPYLAQGVRKESLSDESEQALNEEVEPVVEMVEKEAVTTEPVKELVTPLVDETFIPEDVEIPESYLTQEARKESLTDKIKQILNKEAVIEEKQETMKQDNQEMMTKIEEVEPVVEMVEKEAVTTEPVKELVTQLVDETFVPEDVEILKPYLIQEAKKESLPDESKQTLNEEAVIEEKQDDQEMMTKIEGVEPVVEVIEKETATTEPVKELFTQLVDQTIIPEDVEIPESYLTQEARKESLTDKIKQILNKESVVKEKKETVAPIPVKEVVTDPVQEEIEVIIPQSTGWEEVIPKHPTKAHKITPIPVIEKEVESTKTSTNSISKVGKKIEECEENEEVLPYPLKEMTQSVVEESTPTKEKSKIFDMLYGLDQEEMDEEPQIKEQDVMEEIPSEVQIAAQPIIQQVQVSTPLAVQQTKVVPQMIEEELEDEEVKFQGPVKISTSSIDSIASQFSDGESIIKIVFVQEEETTINDICTKYNITQESIYDCTNLTAPLCPGDHVMINYGQYRRN